VDDSNAVTATIWRSAISRHTLAAGTGEEAVGLEHKGMGCIHRWWSLLKEV
jgi:hypothetical protein